MSYTPENNPYIPGDPYSYDLKWIVKRIKELISAYGKIDSLEKDFEDLKAFVLEYFENADFKQLVSDKLEQMLEDGELADILLGLINALNQYDTPEAIAAAQDDVGKYIMYMGEIYRIADSNLNGKGIQTAKGYAIRDDNTKRALSYDMEKVFKYYLFGLTSSNWTLQGSCRADRLNTTAFIFRNNSEQKTKLITIADTGAIYSYDIPYYAEGGNGITYVEPLNAYLVIAEYTRISEPNFFMISPDGQITASLDASENTWKAANVAYDPKHNRIYAFVVNFTAVYEPVIENNKLKLLATIPCDNAELTMPNSKAYTARQSSVCDEDGNFFLVSSVFYEANYRKAIARVCQINTTTGYIIAVNDFEYANSGTEAESMFIRDRKLNICGYAGGAVYDIIVCIDEVSNKEAAELPAIIYFDVAGHMFNDGMTAETPVNDLGLACSIAGSYPKGAIWMMSNEGENTGSIDLVFRDSLIITSATEDKHDIQSRFYMESTTGYFEIQYCNLLQNGTNHVVRADNSNVKIVLFNCNISGSGNQSGRYIIKAFNSGLLNLDKLEVNDCYGVANINGNTLASITRINGNNTCNRIIDVDYGAIAVVDTSDRTSQGFTNIGGQYGGIILEGIRQDIPM